MRKNKLHYFMISCCILLLSGCAVYPVVQVAGTGMTAYDTIMWIEENSPQGEVDYNRQHALPDCVYERRANERLLLKDITTAKVYVFNKEAYVIGALRSPAEAKEATGIVASVRGLTKVSAKFYPLTGNNTEADAQLELQINTSLEKKLHRNDTIIADVVEGHIVLVGVATSAENKESALSIASDAKMDATVVDYIIINSENICIDTTATDEPLSN